MQTIWGKRSAGKTRPGRKRTTFQGKGRPGTRGPGTRNSRTRSPRTGSPGTRNAPGRTLSGAGSSGGDQAPSPGGPFSRNAGGLRLPSGTIFYCGSGTATNESQLNAARFLGEDLSIKKAKDPQILIYHSHSQETFIDSREGKEEDTIVGVGDYLTKLLREDYGYEVIHVRETFDIVNGVIDRSAAYDYSRPTWSRYWRSTLPSRW